MLKTRLTLEPGANGTKKLVKKYGGRLICVRYRYDNEKRVRLKTVELIIEEAPWVEGSALYLVKTGWEEEELREKIKAAGGRWNRERRLWVMSGQAVRHLGLEERVVTWMEIE